MRGNGGRIGGRRATWRSSGSPGGYGADHVQSPPAPRSRLTSDTVPAGGEPRSPGRWSIRAVDGHRFAGPTVTEISERFARVADGLAWAIAAVPDNAWSNPSPCPGWTARDVIRHLTEWIPGPGFLLGTFGVETRPIPPVDDDPAGAWAAVSDAIQGALADADIAERVENCGPAGQLSFESAVAMTCTPDVLIHTWDLAQAAAIAVSLDVETVAALVSGIDSVPPAVDAAMRSSGHFGPRVEVPADADALTRLLGFNGRRATR